MRLRIVYGPNRVLFAPSDTTLHVSSLCKELGSILSSVVGCDVNIKHLQTSDEFLVPNHLVIDDILRDNDELHAVDVQTFMNQEYELCNSHEYILSRRDWNDNYIRKVLVGYHKHNQIYIAFFNAGTITRLELLRKEDILSFVRKDKKTVTLFDCQLQVGDDKSNTCSAKLQVETISEASTICKILVSLQTSSDPQPEIQEISIDISGSKLKLIEMKVAQQAIVNWLNKEISVEIPVASQEGTALPDIITPVTKTEGAEVSQSEVGDLKITQLPCNGELKVNVVQNYASGDNIHLLYDAQFLVVNSSDKPCNIPKIESEYMSTNGKWISFDKTLVGEPGHNRNVYWSNNPYTDIPPNSTTSIVLGAQFLDRAGPMTSSRSRTPPDLPQPMRIRFKLTQSNERQNVLELEQINEELKLAIAKEEDLFWLSCDDAKTLTRYVFKVQKDNSGPDPYFRVYYKGSSSKYYYLADFQKIAWQAAKNNSDCFLIEDLSYEKDSSYYCSQQVYALVDLEKSYVYAFRVKMQTDNCSSEKTFAIPSL